MFELCTCLNSPFYGLKNQPFLMATTRASLRASCMTSLQKIPDNLNFNNLKNEKQLILPPKQTILEKRVLAFYVKKARTSLAGH